MPREGKSTVTLSKDLGEVEQWESSGGGVLLPNGTYDAEIVEAWVRGAETQRGGRQLQADVLSLQYRVISDGEHTGEIAQPDNLSTAEGALGKFKQLVAAIMPSGKPVKGKSFKIASFVGKKLRFRTYQEEWPEHSGNMRCRFTDYERFDANAPAPSAAPSTAAPAGTDESGEVVF